MRFGAFVPYIVPKPADRETFLTFCRRIDEGPYATLAHGERTAWNTLEHFTALAAAAVATSRVRLWSHTLNLPMHPAAFVAKRAATIDVLSGGRYAMTAAIGGRPPDWLASERPYKRFPHATLDAQVAELRRLWAGASLGDALAAPAQSQLADALAEHQPLPPVGPAPVQSGGPPILCAAQGPKGLARAARWADGYAGFIGEADSARATADFLKADAARVLAAWTDAGRTTPPLLSTSCFFALGADARERLARVGADYRRNRDAAISGGEYWLHSADAIRALVELAAAAGFEHLIFITTTDDVAETDELSAILSELPHDDARDERLA